MASRRRVELNSFAAVFAVGNVASSLGFFLGQLGFREHFRMGEPPSYAIVERDAVSIHLMPASDAPDRLGRSAVYVFVTDVDRLHAELRALGCPIEMPPTDFFYGMREMSVRDPDGNRITFGREARASS
jgi:uncharacterized glyoxalase superfamily protein PhnB